MALELHGVGYGPDATARLVQLVAAAKGGDPLRPVTIVVPSNFVGVSVRRCLAGAFEGGVIGISILTVYRIAELLGAPRLAAAGRRPVSTPVIGAAIRTVLAEAPGLFAPVREHPATEEALVAAHRELSECTEDALERLAGASARAAEVVRVHRAARDRLAGDWYDESDLMAAAREALAGSTVLRDLGRIVLHLPQRLTPAAADLVTSLAGVTDVDVVAGVTGRADADEDLVATLGRLGLALPANAVPPGPVAPAPLRVISVSDADEEVRSAVQAIVDGARDGVPLERMAILYPSPEPYGRIVAEHFAAAGIRWNGRAVVPLSQRLAGRWLLDLLELEATGWSRPAVLGLFATIPVAAGGATDRIADWERASRDAGIVDGRDQWRERLGARRDELQRMARELADRPSRDPDDEDGTRRERSIASLHGQAATVEQLLRAVSDVQAEIDRAGEMTSWAQLSRWAADALQQHLGNDTARATWPDEEQVAAQKVETALARLGGLDLVESTTDLATFARALELELGDDLGRVGTMGQGVLVGTWAAGLGIDLDLVVVLGLAEGIAPSRPHQDALLADDDRQQVSNQLPTSTSRIGTQHRHLLAALAAARTGRVLVMPRGDLRRSLERVPSRWLLDAVEAATGHRELALAGELVELVPSYAARAGTDGFPVEGQAFRLRAGHRLVAGGRGDEVAALDPVWAAGAALVAGRGGATLTRFNGDLRSVAELLAARHGPEQLVSASRLQSYVACPHGYLVERVLGIEAIENPEEQLQISALDRGSLVHHVLECWLGEQIEDGPLPSPSQPWSDLARQRLAEIAERELDVAAESLVVGHRVLWQRDRAEILADLLEFADRDDLMRRERSTTPLRVEAGFGYEPDPPLAIDLATGRRLLLRGRIDRIDRCDDGSLLVTDYKTGSRDRYAAIGEATPDAAGTQLQLLLYGLAARQLLGEADVPVHAQFWFTSSKGSWGTIGYAVDDAKVQRLHEVLSIIDTHLRTGWFPQRPDAPQWRNFVSCHYCDPDGLGTAARHREWERLMAAPELRDLLGLIEPDVVAAP